MIKELLPKISTIKELRKFAITMCVAFFLIGGFLFIKGKNAYLTIWIISSIFLLSGLFLPKILKPIYIIWMVFANIMSWIMTRIILGILFFLVFTPMGLVSKIIGKEFVSLKWKIDKPTYWNYIVADDKTKRNYEQQF